MQNILTRWDSGWVNSYISSTATSHYFDTGHHPDDLVSWTLFVETRYGGSHETGGLFYNSSDDGYTTWQIGTIGDSHGNHPEGAGAYARFYGSTNLHLIMAQYIGAYRPGEMNGWSRVNRIRLVFYYR